MTYILLAVVLLAAIALAVLGYYYLRFRRTPARVWKGRLLSAKAGLEEKLRAARRTLADIDAETTAVRQEYLDRHLRGLSIDSLLGYPGIGPGTIGKLKDAGINSVDAALRVQAGRPARYRPGPGD